MLSDVKKRSILMPVEKTCKAGVIVVGGGVAGVSAAIAAARNAESVTLIESGGCLGGQATLGFVAPLDATRARDGKSFGGIAQETLDQCRAASERLSEGESGLYNKNPSMLRFILLDMAHKAGVNLFFHATLFQVRRGETGIEAIYAMTKSGVYCFEAKVFVDATGDADLVALAGERFALGSEPGVFDELAEAGFDKMHYEDTEYKPYAQHGLMQPVSIMFKVGGVTQEASQKYCNKRFTYEDLGITRAEFEKLPYAGLNGFEANDVFLPLPQGRFLFGQQAREGEYTVNMTRVIGINGADAESLNRGELLAQQQVLPIIDLLRRLVPGFERCYLIDAGMRLGVRETRRLVGMRVLRGREAIRCVPQKDVVAHGSYMIDIHDPTGKAKAVGGDLLGNYYDIPYGSLVAASTDNLLCAGRCISVDHVAHSSTRIQGTCMLTGQAAGTAAAMAISLKVKPADVPVSKLQNKLIADGVNLHLRRENA